MKAPKGERDAIAKRCLEVAREFPGLSTAGFYAEVGWSFYPRVNEYDIKGEVLRLISYGDLVFTTDYKVNLPGECF